MDCNERLAISVPEAAELLGVSAPIVYDLCRSADFPAVRIGRRTLINRRLLQEWLDHKAGGGSAGE